MLDAIDNAPKTGGELMHPAVPGMPDVDGMLDDFARQNPNLAWLPRMIAAQRQYAQVAPEVDPRLAEIDALNDALAQSEAREDKLRRIARRLSAELDQAQGLLADLAGAFGACGLCWGDDDRCRSCRGRGKPGRFAPDPALRLRFFAQRLELPAASGTSTPPDHSERR